MLDTFLTQHGFTMEMFVLHRQGLTLTSGYITW